MNVRASVEATSPSHHLEDEDSAHSIDFPLPEQPHSSRLFVFLFSIVSCIVDTGAVIGIGLAGIAIARGTGLTTAPTTSVVVGIGISYVIVAWLIRIYPRRRAALRGGQLTPVVRLLGVLSAGALAFRFGEEGFSVRELGLWAGWLAASIAVIYASHRVLAALVRNFAAAQFQRPTVVIGNNAAALQLVRGLKSDGVTPYRLVGYFDDTHEGKGPLDGMVPYIGTLDDVARFSERFEELDVFLAVPWTDGQRIIRLVEQLRFLPATLRLIPDLSAFAALSDTAAAVEAKHTLVLHSPPLPPYQRAIKEAMDLGLGSLVLILISPILIGVAIAIKLDSPGSVIFRQPRRGQYGRLFSIYKFRSLHTATADANADRLVTKGDSRVTRVGRFIRKYSLDELPQIINVLKGDMSLVGPRPHAINAKADGKLYADVVPNYALRYRVKPGMTGWAQINGWRGETDTEEKLRRRVEFDFYYITHGSPWLDFVILFRTVPAMLFPPPTNT
jgi:Undecaprenyl-phosphate glucose phosphotransferase